MKKQLSFRGTMLQALDDGAINTIDDLELKLDEYRKKIQDNIIHAARDGLVKRLRDDVTGLPAYQITKEGRNYLAMSTPGALPDFAPQPIEAPASPVVETQTPAREFDGGLEMAYTRILVPPAAKDAETKPDPDQPSMKFLIVSQVGHLFGNFEECVCLASAKNVALKAARDEGISFEVYRVELMGHAFPPSSATWQDA